MSFSDLDDPTRLPPIGSRYELLEPIARGGVAWVWRAQDLVLDRPVAVKVLRADANPELAERFSREAQIAAKVRHRNVVGVLDAGVHDGMHFLAMELLEGETLRARLRRDGPLPSDEVRRIGRSLAGGLDAVRRAGLVHGDVKPENVIVRDDGEVTLTDLGLARAIWEVGTDDETSIWGTPGYVAPERRRGEPGDHRSDVYALGALLFECATGTPPPPEGELPWASLVTAQVPDELAAVIARATLPDPDERYPTAAALALHLAGDPLAYDATATQAIPIADRETIALRPPIQRRSALARRTRRRRLRIAGALLLAVALVAGIIALRPPPAVAVPDLAGEIQADATQRLETLELDAGIAVAYSTEVPAGSVISQDPEAGTSIRPGSIVTLTISLGPRIVKVPEVAGLGPIAARRALERAGFTEIRERELFSDDVVPGRVVGTRPADGQLAEGDAPIVMLVSKGVEQVRIPSVKDLSRAQAIEQLREAGVAVLVTTESHERVAEGTSIRTKPTAGKRVSKGSEVTLVISEGPPKVAVPNLRCLHRKDADDAVKSASLVPQFEGGGPRVVDQNPAPGEQVRQGSTVTLLLGRGVFC